MTFIFCLIIVGILFLVPAAICVWLWGLILVPIFGVAQISFWGMYGLIWMIQLMTGSLIEELWVSSSVLGEDILKIDEEE